MTVHSPPAPDVATPGNDWVPGRTQIFAVLGVYYAYHIVARTLISQSADLDESEQLVLTQALTWGYSSQPPLYTWLQIFIFNTFGVSIFSLALLKNLLLFGTCVLTWSTARLVTRNHAAAIAAAVSLFFLPQFAWESQRDLTHSVLASTLSITTLLCFFRLHSERSTPLYFALGLCVGLGLLSKYNYALFLAGLLIAAASLREFRSVILDKRTGLASVVALLVLFPHGLWILRHHDLAILSTSKFHIAEARSWFPGVLSGLGSILRCAVSFLGPLVLVYLLVFTRTSNRIQHQPRLETARLLLRLWGVVFLLITLGVIVFRVTSIRDRWFQPILICAPVLAIILLLPRLNSITLRRILAAAASVMIVVAVLIPGRILTAERFQRTNRLNMPFSELATQMKPALEGTTVVVTDDHLLGGNLRLNLPDTTFVTAGSASPVVPHPDDCAFVWDATRNPFPPENLANFAARIGVSNLSNASVQYFEATLKYHQTRKLKVALILPPSQR